MAPIRVGDWTDSLPPVRPKACPVAFCQYEKDRICFLNEEFAGAFDADDFYYVPRMEDCLEVWDRKLDEANDASLWALCESFRWEWRPVVCEIDICELCGGTNNMHSRYCWWINEGGEGY